VVTGEFFKAMLDTDVDCGSRASFITRSRQEVVDLLQLKSILLFFDVITLKAYYYVELCVCGKSGFERCFFHLLNFLSFSIRS